MKRPRKVPRDPNSPAAPIVAPGTGPAVPDVTDVPMNDVQAITGAQTGNPPIVSAEPEEKKR